MRIALVHDYLTQLGGAERVLEELSAMYPDAPIFTLLYDEGATRGVFRDREIVTSFLQRWPFARRHHRMFPVVMPLAIERLAIEEFDIVISDSAGFAKGIIVPKSTRHLSFCHTPLRYAWDDSQRYLSEFQAFPKLLKFLAPAALTYLRLWDYAAAQRPDVLLANSEHVRRRIAKYYGRDAAVIYPPVRTDFFGKVRRNPGSSFLMAGRLLAYKRFDLGIAAAKAAGVPLRIVGDGPEFRNLARSAGSSVTFLGAIDDEALREELGRCRAFLFPQEEDFGIIAVEAMAAGVPVIAYGRGGALETVRPGRSGILVREQTVEAFAEALRTFRDDAFDPERVRCEAARFDEKVFRTRIAHAIAQLMEEGEGKGSSQTYARAS